MNNGTMVTTRRVNDDDKERRDTATLLAQELRRQGRTLEALTIQFDDIALRALMLTANLANVITSAPIGDEAKPLIGQVCLAAVQQVQGMTGELKSLHQEQQAFIHKRA